MAEVTGVTSNVLKRVVRIVVGPASATAFTIDVDGRQYLVTAKHVIATLKKADEKVQICGSGGKCIDTEVSILRCEDPIDIAVLVPRALQTVTFPLPATSDGMVLGQDVYFVGFPYADQALTTTVQTESIGFVRKAVWSAQERKDNFNRMYFDGRNNSGFSGSPIVYLEQGKPGFDFKVAAVVSGYRSDIDQVMKLVPIKPEEITDEDRALNLIISFADGSYRKLTPTDQVIRRNTGIIIAYRAPRTMLVQRIFYHPARTVSRFRE